jgi:hypothetical protein
VGGLGLSHVGGKAELLRIKTSSARARFFLSSKGIGSYSELNTAKFLPEINVIIIIAMIYLNKPQEIATPSFPEADTYAPINSIFPGRCNGRYTCIGTRYECVIKSR